MSLIRIAWRNLGNRKLQTLITILVIALGISMTFSVMMLSSGIKDGIAEASKPYGMLVGSKGSANQLVFNTIYYMDHPLANLPLAYVNQIAEDERVQQAVPFALGDNYRGFRIVGTSKQLFALRAAPSEEPYFQMEQGRMFDQPFEAVIGAKVAQATGLAIGDTFQSGHGVIEAIEDDHSHAEHPYSVVGVLSKKGAPADSGIFVPIESYWISHGQHELASEGEQGVTSILVQPDSYMHLMQLYSEINNGQVAQAVFPGQVLAKVFDMMGTGEQVWKYVSYIVLGMTVLTILLFLYNSTLEKRRFIAIMRAIGAGRWRIFTMVILESAWIVMLGTLLGIGFSFVLSYIASGFIAEHSTIPIVLSFSWNEVTIIALVWAIGILAAILPAVIAYRTEISRHIHAN